MDRDLRNMTLDELWELFPITLTHHRPEWKSWADEEIALLSEILSVPGSAINHIGSTAIDNILSKPIVDLLVEVGSDADYDGIRQELESRGYICMATSGIRMSFNKGYTPEGYAVRVFHIHVRRQGDNAEIGFRDYLNSHPDEAKEYEALKLNLLARYRKNRDAYTEAKSGFVDRINRLSDRQD